MSRTTYCCKNGNYYRYKPVPVRFIKYTPCCELETVKFANGKPVFVNNIVYDYKACECLSGLHIVAPNLTEKTFVIECNDIEFKCISTKTSKPTKDKISVCLKYMQQGKCPYKFARQLFTNIPNKKSK